MGRATKPTKTSENATTVPPTTQNVESVPAPPVSDKKQKKSKKVTEEVAPVSVETTENVATSEQVPETSEDVNEQSAFFLSKFQKLINQISSLKTEYRNIEKKWMRELKLAQKLSTKRKRKAGNRAPSGFVKPTRISDELASFLEKQPGTEMARTEVTRDINKYIRTNNLQDKVNGRKINPDQKLATLLKLKKTDELTYFNLQRYMSPHFAKSDKVEAVSSA